MNQTPQHKTHHVSFTINAALLSAVRLSSRDFHLTTNPSRTILLLYEQQLQAQLYLLKTPEQDPLLIAAVNLYLDQTYPGLYMLLTSFTPQIPETKNSQRWKPSAETQVSMEIKFNYREIYCTQASFSQNGACFRVQAAVQQNHKIIPHHDESSPYKRLVSLPKFISIVQRLYGQEP